MTGQHFRPRAGRKFKLIIALGAVVTVCVGSVGAGAATPPEGSQGTNTAVPPTNSAAMLSGASVLGASSQFANLSLRVNQTANLTNQAISVTWSGGTPTDSDLGASGRIDDNYLQIFECWGPDDHENPLNPGPAPTNCEFGANELNSPILGLSDAASGGPIVRQLLGGDNSKYAYVDPNGTGTFMPFQPVDGSSPLNIPTQPSTNPVNQGNPVWANQYFDYTTTNEVDYARTQADGTGSVLFTVDTGLEAPGLGCGEQVTQPDGKSITPNCWLVVVPRGTPTAENPSGTTNQYVLTSALSGQAWAHRIAFPLSFNPIGSSCPLGSDERRIVGSELLLPAVTSWEPTLCASPTSPPYQYSPLSDDQARQELVAGTTQGGPGMAVVSRALDPAVVNPADSVTYAPLSLSAVVIGFNVDREVNHSLNDASEEALAGQRVQHVYLTPRLVAKLLTESYLDQFYRLNPATPPTGYDWLKKNPGTITADPDFLQFNPEFQLLQCAGSTTCGGLIVEQPTADASYELWRWILADPEARSWLDGSPDQWGMKVNPFYSTITANNPSGTAFGNPLPEGFPKSDPYSYQDTTQLPGANNQPPRPLYMNDILPYALSMQSAALEAAAANDGDKTLLNQSALSPDTAWTSPGPLPLGFQFDMTVTDSADAAQYGLQTASLSRAGDDGANRAFVAADPAGIEAGAQVMQPASSSASVLEPNVSTSSTGAYPLPVLTYGAVTPASLDKQSCSDYAGFIRYAVSGGQVQGVSPGDLPPGYAPLSPTLVSASTSAAQQIVANCAQEALQSNPSTPGTSGTSAPSLPSNGTGLGSSSSSSPNVPGATSATGPTNGTTASIGAATTRTGPSNTRSKAPPSFTSKVEFALTRLVLPILFGIGILAGLGARWLDVWPRRVRRQHAGP